METLLEKAEVIRNWRNFLGNNFSEIRKRLRENLKITLLEIFQFFQNPLAILIRIFFNFSSIGAAYASFNEEKFKFIRLNV